MNRRIFTFRRLPLSSRRVRFPSDLSKHHGFINSRTVVCAAYFVRKYTTRRERTREELSRHLNRAWRKGPAVQFRDCSATFAPLWGSIQNYKQNKSDQGSDLLPEKNVRKIPLIRLPSNGRRLHAFSLYRNRETSRGDTPSSRKWYFDFRR